MLKGSGWLALGAFVGLGWAHRRPGFQAWERRHFERLLARRTLTRDRVAEGLEQFGQPGVLVVLGALVGRRLLPCVLGSVALEAGVKHVYARQRPRGADETTHSFPSGHVANTLVTFGRLASLAPPGAARTGSVAATSLLVGVMAWGRVYSSSHHVGDALGGVALGWSWLACCLSWSGEGGGGQEEVKVR